MHLDVSAKVDRKCMITSSRRNRSGVYSNPLERGISFNPNPSMDGKLNLMLKESFKRLKLEITDLGGWIVRTMDLNEIQAGYSRTRLIWKTWKRVRTFLKYRPAGTACRSSWFFNDFLILLVYKGKGCHQMLHGDNPFLISPPG